MSDTLNALQAANRSSSVLQSIANPAQVNPLAATQAGISAASNEYDLASKQGSLLVGQALQQATDENGVLDVPKAQRIAAGMGPSAALAMQGFLKTGSELRGAQIVQSTNQLGFNNDQQTHIAKGLGAMINQPDEVQTPAAYKAQLLQLRANGTIDDSHLAAANAAIDALGPNPDARAMRLLGTRMLVTGLSTADIARQALPQTEILHGPQADVPFIRQPAPLGEPPTGGIRQAPGGFTPGVAPAAGQAPDTRPGAPPGTYTPVIPPGGGGTQPQLPIQAQPGVQPGRIRPPPGSPLLNPAAPPPAGAPATSTPAAPGAPPAAPAPAPGLPIAAGGQPTYTAPPAGQSDVLGKDIEARTAANAAMGDQQKRLIAGQTALQALNLASTGPGTGTTSRMYAFLQAQSPGNAPPQGAMSDTAWRQVLVKNLLRFAQSSSPRASTDQQLSTQIESNPNPEQLAPAIHHILVQDLGVLKRDIAQTQEMPAASGTGAVVKHVGDFPANTAPEAFMWNEYSGDQRKAIEKEYEDKGQTKKLHDSLEIAVRRGAIPDPRKAASAAPPAIVAPPPPAPNALVPTN